MVPTGFYFGVEIVDGQVKAAGFKSGLFEPLIERLPFMTDELKGVKLSSDELGRTWVKSIELNSRHLNWVFTRGMGEGLESCVPTHTLKSINPAAFKFEFDLSSILVDLQISSTLGEFSGQRKDGHFYQSSLYLIQKFVK